MHLIRSMLHASIRTRTSVFSILFSSTEFHENRWTEILFKRPFLQLFKLSALAFQHWNFSNFFPENRISLAAKNVQKPYHINTKIWIQSNPSCFDQLISNKRHPDEVEHYGIKIPSFATPSVSKNQKIIADFCLAMSQSNIMTHLWTSHLIGT